MKGLSSSPCLPSGGGGLLLGDDDKNGSCVGVGVEVVQVSDVAVGMGVLGRDRNGRFQQTYRFLG